MRVSFDLDDTLFVSLEGVKTEPELKFTDLKCILSVLRMMTGSKR